MKTRLLLLLFVTILASCGTSKTTSIIKYATPTTEEVEVLGTSQIVPKEAILLGSVKIGDAGFTTRCTYAEVIRDASIQAQAMGGNLIYIRKHKNPNIWSSCHRITCDVYKIEK